MIDGHQGGGVCTCKRGATGLAGQLAQGDMWAQYLQYMLFVESLQKEVYDTRSQEPRKQPIDQACLPSLLLLLPYMLFRLPA